MSTVTHAGFDQAAFDAFLAGLDEPGWLTESRRNAWSAFCEQAWPGQGNEEWMRTDIRLFNLNRFSPLSDETQVPDGVEELLAEAVTLGGATASVNGRCVRSHIDEKWASRGVLFGSLQHLINEYGDVLRPYLSHAVDPLYDKFSTLHSSFWSGGSVLYVPRGVVVDEPFYSLASMTDGGVDMGHTLVILEEGSEATFLSESASPSEHAGGLHCGANELIVGPGAHLRYVNLQNWGQGCWHFAHQKALVDRDASLQWTVAAMGGRLAKVNQHVGLVGPGANSQVNGVLFTEGKQHLAYHTLQHHIAPSCRSDFLYKAALQDKSRTVWRGMIKVDPKAQQTDGYQRNDNLLLSHQARSDSIPGLEIEADDVRCTHGSTSGRVDEELIFYAQCRGLTRQEAIRAIVTGFFQQIFDRITIDSVRDALGHAIARRVREYE